MFRDTYPFAQITDILSGSAKKHIYGCYFRALILVNLSECDVRGYFVSDSYSHVFGIGKS